MYLIFNLCRPDIFPVDDIGLLRGICKCYNLNYPIKKEAALKCLKIGNHIDQLPHGIFGEA